MLTQRRAPGRLPDSNFRGRRFTGGMHHGPHAARARGWIIVRVARDADRTGRDECSNCQWPTRELFHSELASGQYILVRANELEQNVGRFA
jgi:hypothetical protein